MIAATAPYCTNLLPNVSLSQLDMLAVDGTEKFLCDTDIAEIP
jgi:hypothetical protein